MKKMTFKEYLESKEKLRQAIGETPIQSTTHIVNKYCKIPVGETKEDKQYVSLKPKQKIVVEWRYVDINNPDVNQIQFEDVKDIEPTDSYETFWNNEKFQKWLLKNTREV